MQGKSEEERNKTAMEKIESVGLIGFENQYPNQLSGECSKELVLLELWQQIQILC